MHASFANSAIILQRGKRHVFYQVAKLEEVLSPRGGNKIPLSKELAIPEMHYQILVIVVCMRRRWKRVSVVLMNSPNLSAYLVLLLAHKHRQFGWEDGSFQNNPFGESGELQQELLRIGNSTA